MNFWYNKTVELWKKGKKGKNALKQDIYIDPEKLMTIECDVQPYSREEVLREYGLDVDVKYRIFMDEYPNIDGTYLVYKGSKYDVVKTLDWDNYCEVIVVDRVS